MFVEDDLKALETKLRESERRFELLSEVTAVGSAFHDKGIILFANQILSQMFGFSPTEMIGKSVLELVAPESRHEFVGRLQSADESIYENLALRKDGSTFFAKVEEKVAFHEGKMVRGTFIRDMSEQKRDEIELEHYRSAMNEKIQSQINDILQDRIFIESIIENIPHMIFIKEAKELRFVRFNRAGEELLGYAREELIGKNDYDFFPKDEADSFTSKDRNVLFSGTLLDIPEEEIHTRYKGTRILHTKKIPLKSPGGECDYLLGISEDITEKKQAEEAKIRLAHERVAREEAEKAVQLRDDFISVAAHELKTPLTSLVMQIQLINRLAEKGALEKLSKERMFELIVISQQQLDRFSVLIHNLLDVSRIAGGRLVLLHENVELSELVRGVVTRFHNELNRAKCLVELDALSGVVGYWDRYRIEQIVVNLLSNAMKFGAGRPIVICVRRTEKTAILNVRDYGIGIAECDQSRIFDRFERAVSLKRFSGLGLGLYIVRQIVESHCGTILVESEKDHGSNFIIELPLAAVVV